MTATDGATRRKGQEEEQKEEEERRKRKKGKGERQEGAKRRMKQREEGGKREGNRSRRKEGGNELFCVAGSEAPAQMSREGQNAAAGRSAGLLFEGTRKKSQRTPDRKLQSEASCAAAFSGGKGEEPFRKAPRAELLSMYDSNRKLLEEGRRGRARTRAWASNA